MATGVQIRMVQPQPRNAEASRSRSRKEKVRASRGSAALLTPGFLSGFRFLVSRNVLYK